MKIDTSYLALQIWIFILGLKDNFFDIYMSDPPAVDSVSAGSIL